MWIEIGYWIGVLGGIGCVYDLFTAGRTTLGLGTKTLISIVMLAFSWIGIAAYLIYRHGARLSRD